MTGSETKSPHRYAAFGGVLESELELEELAAAPLTTSVDWRLQVAAGAPPPLGTLVGEEVVNASTNVRCHEVAGGIALAFDDTGTFVVQDAGRTITWYRPADVRLEAAREDVLGRVLSIALHEHGLFCLHSSAVACAGKGIAFLAPKHHGKSSLALELTRQGAAFVTDDMLPVLLASPVQMLPGVPRVRLWRDAVAHFAVDDTSAAHDAKRVLSLDEIDDSALRAAVPFAAAYVLEPVPELPDGGAVERELLGEREAALAILGMGKVTGLLGRGRAIDALQRASQIAAEVPVYQLYVVRDYSRLGEVAATLAGWTASA